MNRIYIILWHILCIAICLAATKALLQRDRALFAQFGGPTVRINWVRTVGEGLSVLILAEGLPLVGAAAATAAKPTFNIGRLYVAACTCFMLGYCAIRVPSTIINYATRFQGDLLSSDMALEILDDLLIGWSTDWEQLGYLTLGVAIYGWVLSRAPDGIRRTNWDATELLGVFLFVVMPLASILHPAFAETLH